MHRSCPISTPSAKLIIPLPRALPSGIYYAIAKLEDHTHVRKLVWLGDRR